MIDLLALDALNTVEEIEETIKKHTAHIRSLRRLKNARFVAACRLPPEFLALVFERLAFYLDSSSGTPAHPCLRVSQVCTAWREIALGLPSIWGIVYTNSSKRWLEEMQRRSGSCPLLFRRGMGLRSDTNASFALLREQTHRTKTIDL